MAPWRPVIDGEMDKALDRDRFGHDGQTDAWRPRDGLDLQVVDTDAKKDPTMLGAHMVTISHPASEDDDEDQLVADKVIDFDVAGPPHGFLRVRGQPDHVHRAGSGFVPVCSRSPPWMKTWQRSRISPITAAMDNSMVEVFIQGLPDGNVTWP